MTNINSQMFVIHCDMDQFYAAVEIRDNPSLKGLPVIVGALPNERGVVSTCSYEARKFGVRSAMSIKEAYRLCPQGIYLHPNFEKYYKASQIIRKIWDGYTDIVEHISLDEGYLDVTKSMHLFGGAYNIGKGIKERVLRETGLTCSVGIGYSMMSAKLASEEKKPDGFFEIPSACALKDLIIDRDVRIIYGIGVKTAQSLKTSGIKTVRDIYANKQAVINTLGNYGRHIVNLAEGIDERKVTPYAEAQSLGKEHTFQQDITDREYLKDVLILTAKQLSYEIQLKGIYCRTVTLKVTYDDMKKITRSVTSETTNRADKIYKAASLMLDKTDKRPIRLIGISLSGFTDSNHKQLSLMDTETELRSDKLDPVFLDLQKQFGFGIIKTGTELKAFKNVNKDNKGKETP